MTLKRGPIGLFPGKRGAWEHFEPTTDRRSFDGIKNHTQKKMKVQDRKKSMGWMKKGYNSSQEGLRKLRIVI